MSLMINYFVAKWLPDFHMNGNKISENVRKMKKMAQIKDLANIEKSLNLRYYWFYLQLYFWICGQNSNRIKCQNSVTLTLHAVPDPWRWWQKLRAGEWGEPAPGPRGVRPPAEVRGRLPHLLQPHRARAARAGGEARGGGGGRGGGRGGRGGGRGGGGGGGEGDWVTGEEPAGDEETAAEQRRGGYEGYVGWGGRGREDMKGTWGEGEGEGEEEEEGKGRRGRGGHEGYVGWGSCFT